jgi:serine/threonine-protein kinase
LTQELKAWLTRRKLEALNSSWRQQGGGYGDEVIRVLDALDAIHEAELVHRDIKPANIYLKNRPVDLVKVIDLGLAAPQPKKYHKGVGTEKEMNRAGTPVYASPEQFRDMVVGPASDIYSLGIVLYEMVTGVVPFAEKRGESESEIPHRHSHEMPKDPRQDVSKLPEDVAEFMLSLLEKEPNNRPSVAAAQNEVQRLLERHRDGPTVVKANPLAPPARVTEDLPVPTRMSTEEAMVGVADLRRDNRAWLVAAIVGVLVLVGAAIAVKQSADEQAKPEGTGTGTGTVAVAAASPPAAPVVALPASTELMPLVAPPEKTTPGDEPTALPLLPSSPAPLTESVKKATGARQSHAVAAQPAVTVTVSAPEDCDLDSKITYAREVRATLLASKRASLPAFQNAEDALDRAISERNCRRVIQAVEGLRRAAGVPTPD